MIRTRISCPAGLLAALLGALSAQAESVYQQPADFISTSFPEPGAASRALWVTDEIRNAAREILQRDIQRLRIRYWQQGNRTAWILNEIGKDLPITTGVIVENGRIETVKVLVFRESRGWEVRYPFFTDQFIDARITDKKRLDRDIDNISGATLSVNALVKQAALALLLSNYVQAEVEQPGQHQ